MTDPEPSARTVSHRQGHLATAVFGAVLIVCAFAANERWFDRHFLPSFFLPRLWYVRILTAVRIAMVGIGVWFVYAARRRTRRPLGHTVARTASILVAAVLAIGASELVLRYIHLRPAEWLVPEEEPRRQSDATLGWTFVPSRTGHAVVAGRTIEYTFDAAGYRVRRIDEPVDPNRPTILCIGESVMFGEGLAWEESVPGQVGSLSGIQSANLAVHGYSTNQAYLRLRAELPHFRHPVAVVSLFMTALFGRNLDDDRPHLGPGLVWLPAQSHARLASLAKLLVPYRRDETVERGIAMTRDVLTAMVAVSRDRGATPLVVVPQLGREEAAEHTIRRRVLDDAHVPYVLVEIDDAWRLSWDRHPNAPAAHVIAAAIVARLHLTTVAPGQTGQLGAMHQTDAPK